MRSVKHTLLGILMAVVLIGIMGNNGCSRSSESRQANAKMQDEIAAMATRAEPAYHPKNFLARHYVNEYMRRMDTPSKMFYVYTKNYQGQVTGFYTARSFPLSVCTLLTPPDREVSVHGSGANPLGAAPSLEGTYQGGKCGNVFFFDASTNAYIELSDHQIYQVSDQPLSFPDAPNVQHITVSKASDGKDVKVPMK